ncbi:MAG: hypothetical protein HN719_10080 [Alphaproteobacteria bacterium]|jgi:hypothetical protein|nr:hypothetical protein [Alphaproteobacteria bacterium]
MVFAAVGGALIFLFACPVQAASETVRRLAAEIVVLKADGERMLAPDLSPQHRAGMEERLRGGLAIVPLLIRAARNNNPSIPAFGDGRVAQILGALDARNTTAVNDALGDLATRYPFDTTGLLPPDNRAGAILRAKSLHESYCGGCHDDPDLNTRRPAWNLFGLAQNIPPAELAARLVIGVRGDGLTGLDNPLRNAEISALIALYRGAQPKRP